MISGFSTDEKYYSGYVCKSRKH